MQNSVSILAMLPWYTEGPVVDKEGNIYFTTLTGGKIKKLDTKGNLSDWAEAENPNGQLILSNGDHLVCDSGSSSINRYDREGKFKGYDIEGSCAGERVYSPNDLVADSKGGIYFTDSIRENGKVFYYRPQGIQRIVERNLDFPNGIALANEGNLLFVSESYRNRILMFRVLLNGASTGHFEIFAELPSHNSGDILKNLPDGIKTGSYGNLLVAHYGMQAIQVLSPQGKVINSINTEFPLTSNLCVDGNFIVVTGGYKEPGPGGVLRISLENG